MKWYIRLAIVTLQINCLSHVTQQGHDLLFSWFFNRRSVEISKAAVWVDWKLS